jgi:hypothetical protein
LKLKVLLEAIALLLHPWKLRVSLLGLWDHVQIDRAETLHEIIPRLPWLVVLRCRRKDHLPTIGHGIARTQTSHLLGLTPFKIDLIIGAHLLLKKVLEGSFETSFIHGVGDIDLLREDDIVIIRCILDVVYTWETKVLL